MKTGGGDGRRKVRSSINASLTLDLRGKYESKAKFLSTSAFHTLK